MSASESDIALVQIDEEVGVVGQSSRVRQVRWSTPLVAFLATAGLLVAACVWSPLRSSALVASGDEFVESGDDFEDKWTVMKASDAPSCKNDGAKGILGPLICRFHGFPPAPPGGLPKSQYLTESDSELVEKLIGRVEAFLQSAAYLQNTDEQRRTYNSNGLKAFKEWSGLHAKDVLAFRETWSDKDTELLKVVDDSEDGFCPGAFTTTCFAKRLPTFEAFDSMLKHRLSIVGNGNTISGKGLGKEIDKGQLIARFNGFVGGKMEEMSRDVGTRIDIHIMNGNIQAATKDVTQVDFEWYKPWESWCRRYNAEGKFYAQDDDRGPIYMFRPTWRCALASRFYDFTRGFLFWWFMGRHFDETHMYGFGGDKHFRKDGKIFVGTSIGRPGKLIPLDPVEQAIHFEHIVYREYGKLKEDFTVV